MVKLYRSVLRNAPHAVLTVLGYPRILPADYTGVPVMNGSPFCVFDHYPLALFQTLDVGMPVTDARDVDLFVTQLNNTVRQAVATARNDLGTDAYRIQYADAYSASVPRNCKGTTPGATVTGLETSALGQGVGGSFFKLFTSTATFHPTVAGQQMFAAQVQASFDASAPEITTADLPDAVVGEPYSADLTTADHRTGTWQIVSGSLPSGLTLSGYTVSGVPDTAAVSSFELKFTDTTGQTASAFGRIQTDTPAPTVPAPVTPGGAYSWGVDTTGELGQGIAGYNRGISPVPAPVALLGPTVTKLAAGGATGYALSADGSVNAWGWGYHGELGNGSLKPSLTPVTTAIHNVTQIAAGGDSALAVLNDGTVWTWGDQPNGTAGVDNSCTCFPSPSPAPVAAGARGLAVGGEAFYTINADKTVSAWGNNAYGQLGSSDAPECSLGVNQCSTTVAAPVDGLTNVTELAAGYFTAYALKGDGTVWAWGDNTYREAGPNATQTPSPQVGGSTPQYTPVQVTGLPPIAHITASMGDGYALAKDGSVWVWGDNHEGALGNGTSGNTGGQAQSAVPVKVLGISGAVGIGATGTVLDGSGFAILADGTVESWGHNFYGQLGYETGTYPSYAAQLTPALIPGLSGVLQVAGGSDTTYGLLRPPGT